MKAGFIALISAAAALFVSYGRNPEYTTATAYDRLMSAADAGKCMYAMQDALCYGRDRHIDGKDLPDCPVDRCDIKSVCGDYPAIAGFDPGGMKHNLLPAVTESDFVKFHESERALFLNDINKT